MNEDFVWTKEEKVNKLFKVLNVLKRTICSVNAWLWVEVWLCIYMVSMWNHTTLI